ncbi:MAG: hypothetical protein D6805_01470 [Planctomycetota bacterium]|nr:MAG: hypothetical protein D6805_01470 [Planctomycetota bacterium]
MGSLKTFFQKVFRKRGTVMVLDIVAPLRWELVPLIRRLEGCRRGRYGFEGWISGMLVRIYWVGVGEMGLRRMVEYMDARVRCVLFIGCAAGLEVGMEVGDIFFCRPCYREVQGGVERVGLSYNDRVQEALARVVSFPVRRSITVREVVRFPRQKARWRRCGAGLLEMENAHVAALFAERFPSLPLIFLRSVLDPLQTTLPEVGGVGELLGAAFFTPWRLFCLVRDFRRCVHSLAGGVVEVLGYLEREGLLDLL